MVPAILLVAAIKYPGLRMGADYSSLTGKTLVHAYAQIGWWAIGLYALSQLIPAIFIIAAVALVSAGLIQAVFSTEFSDLWTVIGLLVSSAAILLAGRYHLLERVVKFVVPLFTLLTFFSVIVALGRLDLSASSFLLPKLDLPAILFIIALAGFMPTPMEASVFQSLWVDAKSNHMGRRPTLDEARFDFNIGFFSSVILALCFLLLGAAVLSGTDAELASSAGGFAIQFIGLFTSAIGDWAFVLIGTISVIVMLSTLITVVDGYPRVAEALLNEMRAKRSVEPCQVAEGVPRAYDLSVILLCVSAVIALAFFMRSFATFIDLTSIMVFVIGPIIAFLNHRAVFNGSIPEDQRPKSAFRIWSILSAILMLFVSLLYFYLRFGI